MNKKISEKTLRQLEWPQLLEKLRSFAQTDEGQERCNYLQPDRHASYISQRWDDVVPLRDIVRSGYKAPVGALPKLHGIFKGVDKGSILEGLELRLVWDLLSSTRKVIAFVTGFSNKSKYLQRLKGQLYGLPTVFSAIEKAISLDGSLLDTASEELQSIRRQKTSLKRRIEEEAAKLLIDPAISQYLQDVFFTVRNEKYVIPIRIDGRGRVKGVVVDTSDSGQTLLIEPPQLVAMNQQLHELEVGEKLEIIAIFRSLSSAVAAEVESLKGNYAEIVNLDCLMAEASLAAEIDAGPVQIVSDPVVNLVMARHPLINSTTRKSVEPNSIALNPHQHVLVVSGPNAGGKTVVLKTVGLLNIMVKAGLLIPADASSQMYLFNSIFLEIGDSQNISANLSTFSGHIVGLNTIIDAATRNDLVLLDELATGTESNTGAAIAQAVLECLADLSVTVVMTTHFDVLKSLALVDQRFRNSSMGYAEQSHRPTYKLILDVPGQSYGLEVAKEMGLSPPIAERARALKDEGSSILDDAVSRLQSLRSENEELKKSLEVELIAAQQEKFRWQQECALIEEQRAKTSRVIAAKLEEQMGVLKEEFEAAAKNLKDAVKDIRHGDVDLGRAIDEKKKAETKLREIDYTISKLSEAGLKNELPGRVAVFDDLRSTQRVFVIPVKKLGEIVKAPFTPQEPIEVQVGVIKIRVGLHDLRIMDDGESSEKSNIRVKTSSEVLPGGEPEFTPQTPSNTFDVRGMDAETAVEKVLIFLDKSLLRGEKAVVVIHGHGTDRLKMAIRSMLKSSCPYNVTFRSGLQNEGGDGATIIALHQ